MALKKEFAKRTINLIFISFLLFIIFTSIYLYSSARTKVNFLNSTVNLIRDTIKDNLLNSMNENITGIYNLFFLQLVLFIVSVTVLTIGLRYVAELYMIYKKDSLIDHLTDVYNRRAIMFGLDREIRRAVRFKHPLSIAILDIDFFKKYNDINGHVAGDRLLERMGKLLKENLREFDSVGRIGGEEFLIIFPELKLDDAHKVCERIRIAVERMHFVGEKNLSKQQVTISIGLITFEGEQIVEKEELIERADKRLYRAKALGRNMLVYN